ncbi:MAG: MmcQ/YjbR family DNA-binding protein [Candidatus Wallbacteria bacterium]|nr:MmcQ/YjbR family DNA-binding protein [Candidatus Wallbacteria bacterium]
MKAKPDKALEKLRAICLTLPDTSERLTWGHPNFRVGEKIFASYYHEDGKSNLGFKTNLLIQEHLVETDARFSVAAYVGQHGWVTMKLAGRVDWQEVEGFVRDSYRLIAPKKYARQLDTPGEAEAAPRSRPRKR